MLDNHGKSLRNYMQVFYDFRLEFGKRFLLGQITI